MGAESGHRVALSEFPKIVSLEWLLLINRPNYNIFPKFQKRFVCYDLLDLNIKFGEDWPRTVAFIAWKPFFRVVEICRYLKTSYFSDFFSKSFLRVTFWPSTRPKIAKSDPYLVGPYVLFSCPEKIGGYLQKPQRR